MMRVVAAKEVYGELMMTPRRLRKYQRGQGLIEYALILILVAVVVIAVAGLVGLAVQRLYGLVAGALGTKYDTVGHLTIDAPGARCWHMSPTSDYPQGFIGIDLHGITDIPFADLTYSTEGSVGTDLDGKDASVEGNPSAPNYKVQYILSKTPPFTCPRVVVIQAKSGAIAISPVTECWDTAVDACPD